MTSRRAGGGEPLAEAKLAHKKHEEHLQEMVEKSAENNVAKGPWTLDQKSRAELWVRPLPPSVPFSDPQRVTPWVYLLYKPCEPGQRANHILTYILRGTVNIILFHLSPPTKNISLPSFWLEILSLNKKICYGQEFSF